MVFGPIFTPVRAIDNTNMEQVQLRHSLRLARSLRLTGFMLIELMTSVAVLALLLVIVAPNFTALVRTSKVRSAQSELVASLTLARSEAVKRALTVSVAAKAPTLGNEFGAGWTVWVDTNGDGVLDPGETIIRNYAGFLGAVELSTAGNATVVIFAPTGFSSASVKFKICGRSDIANGYSVTLQRVGLIDVYEGVACP